MTSLCLVLGDQLSPTLPSLQMAEAGRDIVLMCEVWDEATYVPHHKKKIAFLFSAMRHFAEALKEDGHQVTYRKLDDPENTGSLRGEVERALQQAVARGKPVERIVLTWPGEYRVLEDMRSWEAALGVPVDILDDDRFLSSPAFFQTWAKGKKQLRLEYFYRELRKKHGILMEGDAPVGGKWNYDASNRKAAPADLKVPAPYAVSTDDITNDVLALVAKRFDTHFGDLTPFNFAVTRKQALAVLADFVERRLPTFGDYQDAMVEGEPWMFHAHISFYLNCGLLLPAECIQVAEQAFRENRAPLNAVEGFVRQILGWREYVRNIYWMKMPAYAQENFLTPKGRFPTFTGRVTPR